jgi:hypothetical protein
VEKPQVELAFIVMKQNQAEVEEFKTLGYRLGVDRIRFKAWCSSLRRTGNFYQMIRPCIRIRKTPCFPGSL